MAVVAVTTIRYGRGTDERKVFQIGDTVTGLSDDELRSLVEGGSAVETGKNRKFSQAPTGNTGDELTRKRDELLAKALRAVEEDEADPQPATENLGQNEGVQSAKNEGKKDNK